MGPCVWHDRPNPVTIFELKTLELFTFSALPPDFSPIGPLSKTPTSTETTQSPWFFAWASNLLVVRFAPYMFPFKPIPQIIPLVLYRPNHLDLAPYHIPGLQEHVPLAVLVGFTGSTSGVELDPGGVPVATMSPGRSVIALDRYSTCS